MLPKIECSDQLLLGILNQDSGTSTELGLQHLDECEHCQVRIEELAANEQQWSLAREGLCSRVEGGLDIENEFEVPTRFVPNAEHSSDWTDTMAIQLLQPPSHPEMLGRLGRYEIERLVGSGGMGVVFKAYDSELHRSVAIKMLAPHLSGSRSARERFAREARAAAAIVNDHVVPIHNVETEHATPYLVMQYIAGDSLQARLDRVGPLDVCEILRIGMQVATGLAAAHAQGVIHRDVKPSNIMLDENVARALLTDFGLARTQDEACLTRSGFHPGTPHYMSPEQVRGEELDGRSDLFSLGCVLYALCTGHPPYRADSGYAVMRRITDDQPRSIREQNELIPEWLERIVMRLLEKDRESRFQSAEELAKILEQCLAHVQKPATEPLPLAVAPKASFFDRGGIRNWILAAMASVFLFLAGVFIVLEMNKGTITIKSEADNVPIRIKRSDQVVDEMVVSRTGKSVRLAAGEYVIEFEGDSQDLVVQGGNVSLVRGEMKTLQIVYKKSDSAKLRMSNKAQTQVVDAKAIDIMRGSDDKWQPGIATDASATTWDKQVYLLQSALDSARRKFDEGMATQEDVLSAELELLGAKIAGTKDDNSLPALLKQREGVVYRAFHAAKTKYEAGMIGIDQFSEVVAELVDAKFATRIAADGHAELHASVPQDDASIMLIEEFFVKQEMLGADHPSMLQLRDKVLRLRFDHKFDEAGIQKRLHELNRERQQLLTTRSESHPTMKENAFRQETVASLRSGSFPMMLKILVETDPRRANLLPQEWKGKWVVEIATTGDGSPLDIAGGSILSIFNSTLDWHWGEQSREAFVVIGVTVNDKQSLVELHWRAESPNMQGGAATGDIQWLVEFRDNKLWIVRLDQPDSPVPDSVDNFRHGHTRFILKRAEADSLSDDTIQMKQKIEPGNHTEEDQVTNVRKPTSIP